ncbi:TPA: YadA-like family protein [Enterobacter hormaechei]
MKAVKTLIALAVASSFSANASVKDVGNYLTQQGKDDYEYATIGSSNPDMSFIIKGETAVIGQTDGRYPSDFDLEKLVNDIQTQNQNQETFNHELSNEITGIKTDLDAINNRIDSIPSVDISGKADKADLDAVKATAEQAQKDAQQAQGEATGAVTIAIEANGKADQNANDIKDINDRLDNMPTVDISGKADVSTVTAAQQAADKAQQDADGLKNQMLDKADKASVEAISAAISDKADKATVDAAHAKADQINQILHGAPTTFDTDSTGDIGLIAKVDQNTTDIQVVSNQVTGIVDSVNAAATQAAEAKSQVDVATAKADAAQQTANDVQSQVVVADSKATTAQKTAENAFVVAESANINASAAFQQADAAYNMSTATQKQVAGFDGRITNVENQVQGLNKSFSNLKNQVEKNRKEANAGIAGATAIASIPTIAGSRFSLGAGVGGFQGSQAVAVGATYNFNERVALKAGVSTSSASEVGYGVGLSVGFN